MTRRSPGEGSIQRDGARWKAVLRYKDPATGERRRAVRRARTKTAANLALQELRFEVASTGILSDGRTLVADAADRYLEVKRGQGLAPSSINSQQWMVDIVKDGLGDRKTDDLTVSACDSFLQQASIGLAGRRPIGSQHLRRLRSTLIAIIQNAEREGRVSRNVARHSVLPLPQASDRRDRRSLDLPELQRLIEETKNTALGAAVLLCGVVGLRPAEARALTWDDVDLGESTIRVTKQLAADGRVTEPKTKRASRHIGFDAAVNAGLRSWKKRQLESQLLAGAAWHDSGLVVSTTVGTAIGKDNLRRDLSRATTIASTHEISPYELRHTALTLLSRQGFTNSQLADYAGTSSRVVENTYRHRIDGVLRLHSAGESMAGKHHIGHQQA